jgi:hypothetical protein
MDDKQSRALLGDTIAQAKERLTFTRVRTLTSERVTAIQRALDNLLLQLPQFGENTVYEQE